MEYIINYILTGGCKRMKKSDWQYLVDTLLFICIVGIAFIGFLLGLFLPKGPKAPETAKYFLGLHRHQWGNVHFYLSIAFVILVVIHLLFSWNWIKGKTHQLFKKRWGTVLILIVIVPLLVLFLFWIFYPRVPGAYENYGIRAGRRAQEKALKEPIPQEEEKIFREESGDYIVITGQMTLKDVEKATGLPARQIADKLGLPPKVSLDENLGRLRKMHPFLLQDVRDIVSELLDKKEMAAEEKIEKEETLKKKENERTVKIKQEAHEEKETRGRMAEDTSGILITGRMTLYDIERETGISARTIADKLGLPDQAPLEETLGRLRKRYLFSMQELRDIVASLTKEKQRMK